jgi:hypothetical protein
MKRRFEAAAETKPDDIPLPDLSSHVIDRLENVLEAGWIVVYEREASTLEDVALKLRLWASQSDLAGHESFTKKSYWLHTNEELVSWARAQLLQVDALIGVLMQHADNLGYRSGPQR